MINDNGTPSMRYKRNWWCSLGLSLLLTSCATRPLPNQCPPPDRYLPLTLPEPGHFRKEGHRILTPDPPSMPSTTKPTASSPSAVS